MIMLKKKQMLVIFALVIVSITVGSIQKSNKTIQTLAPITNEKRVIIDAGHGLPDGGAVSKNGITEAEINLKIALKVKDLLEQKGVTVILTRSDENEIYDENCKTIRQKKVSDAKNRVKIGNESNANIFVSIHLNKIPQEQYNGWQCFYKRNNEQSKKLAELIQKGLNETMQKENKREIAKINNVYIVEHIEIPITIVECGFLSNYEEEKNLQNDEYQNKLALGICTGIMKYFSE